jgi:hypothetical protein
MTVNGRQYNVGSVFTLIAVICFALAVFKAGGLLGLDWTALGLMFFAMGHLV